METKFILHHPNREMSGTCLLIFRMIFASIFTAFIFNLVGCESQTATNSPSTSAEVSVTTPSIERGKTVYKTQCIACHHSDPHKPGALGPDVFGSSKELIEARVMRAEYPSGYQPKRSSHTMAPLPHLKNEIDSLYLYLNAKE